MARNVRSDRKKALMDRMKKGMNKGGSDYEQTSIFKSGQDIKFWNVPEDKNWFDIIPYKAGAFDPDVAEGEETYICQPYVHKNIGPNDRDVICLAKSYEKPCPICERIKKMVADGADEDDINEISVQRNPRAIYNVVVRDDGKEEAKGVQVANFSHFTMEMHLLELASKSIRPGKKQESADVDPFIYYASEDKDGRTIHCRRKGKGLGTKYMGHELEERDYAIEAKYLKAAYKLDELLEVPTYEQAEAWLLGDEVSTDDEEEEKPSKRKSSRSKSRDVEDEEPEEVEAEEPEEEEEGLREELEGMSRAKLKKYIKDKELEIVVKAKMSDEDILEAIIEEVEPEEEEESEEKPAKGKSARKTSKKKDEEDCPGGGIFGKDWNELEHCDDCEEELWNACSAKSEEE